ncbi:MAG: roadblock/LC7 domain-containing protein [Anaerolineales bacterium]|jgi:predicted regulator of Ras-like GTPase activity (Roadblock/LC7/MglB family)
MTQLRVDLLVARLRELQAHTADIEASALVSVDGLIIASSLPSGIEEDLISAMSAALHSLGERIAGELGRGALNQVSIRGTNGYVLQMPIGRYALLTVLARKQAKLGLLLLEMNRAIDDLRMLVA